MMEHQKIFNLLNEASGYKFVTRNWNYSVASKIIYSTTVLKSNPCHYNDAYILVRGDITIIGCNRATEVAFKCCDSFINIITKIDGTTIDAEDLDLVMLM